MPAPANLDIERERSQGHIVKKVNLEPIRAVVRNGKTMYRAMAIRFGNPQETDWYGTYFDSRTNFHLDWFKTRPWLYDHTMNRSLGTEKIGDWVDVELDDEGIFFLGELVSSLEYQDAVEELIKRKALYPSTGTLSYVMDWDWEDGWIKEWPIVELSSTTQPAEYRMEAMQPEVVRAVRALEGGFAMSGDQRQTFLEKLLGKKAAEEEDEKVPVVGADDETPSADEDGGVPGAEGGDEADDTTLSVDELAEALHLDDLVKAITMVDARLEQLGQLAEGNRAALQELAKTEVEKVKTAMKDGGWLDKLFVASRDGPMEPEDATPTKPDGEPRAAMSKEEVMERGGPAAIIREQQQQGIGG